jgi:hypothetical protein
MRAARRLLEAVWCGLCRAAGNRAFRRAGASVALGVMAAPALADTLGYYYDGPPVVTPGPTTTTTTYTYTEPAPTYVEPLALSGAALAKRSYP